MLTGPAIRKAVDTGEIKIDPYNWSFAGPNSYDVRLHDEIIVYNVVGPMFPADDAHPVKDRDGNAFAPSAYYIDEAGKAVRRLNNLDARADNPIERFTVDVEKGAVLVPGVVYLGRTIERIHSDVYASTIHGRSSIGRLGVTVHQTAAFIDVGFDGVVTLEITVTHPVRIYAGMRIAQIAFHPLVGEIELYRGKYQGANAVEASKLWKDTNEETTK